MTLHSKRQCGWQTVLIFSFGHAYSSLLLHKCYNVKFLHATQTCVKNMGHFEPCASGNILFIPQFASHVVPFSLSTTPTSLPTPYCGSHALNILSLNFSLEPMDMSSCGMNPVPPGDTATSAPHGHTSTGVDCSTFSHFSSTRPSWNTPTENNDKSNAIYCSYQRVNHM